MVDIVLTSDLLKHRQQMTPEIIRVQKLHTGSKATGNTEMFNNKDQKPPAGLHPQHLIEY